jgi:hypothetical protein
MTAHSPVGLNPENFNVVNTIPEKGSFANNDLYHSDPTGCDHDLFSEGLKKSLFNYMHGIGFELPLNQWFDFKIPRTIIPKNFIERCIEVDDDKELKNSSKIVWIGPNPNIRFYTKNKKGKSTEMATLYFSTKREEVEISTKPEIAKWLLETLESISVNSKKSVTFEFIKNSFNSANLGDFNSFWNEYTIAQLRDQGLIVL